MAIAKGSQVRQIVTAPIEGVVDSFQVDQETGELQMLVVWTDADGNSQSHYFKQSQLELVA